MSTTSFRSRRTVTLERTFQASLKDVWALLTTKAGFESWWGPEGFRTEVERFELRPGGQLRYTMTATGPDQIAYMNNAGMPLAIAAKATITAVDPPRRLAYTHLADFIPGVEPYEISETVELEATGDGVHLTVTLDAMHDDVWTARSVAGWESQLEKLEKLLGSR